MKLYFIQSGNDGAIKIGISADPEKRLKSLQTAHDQPLRLLRSVDCDDPKSWEKALHYRFRRQCVHGEWFSPSWELVNYLLSFQPISAPPAVPTRKRGPKPEHFRNDNQRILVRPSADSCLPFQSAIRHVREIAKHYKKA